jgi:hypothetical protein
MNRHRVPQELVELPTRALQEVFHCAPNPGPGMLQIKWVMESEHDHMSIVNASGGVSESPLVFQRNPEPIPQLRVVLQEAIEAWLHKSPSPHTRTDYRRDLEQFQRFTGINPEHSELLKRHMRPLSAAVSTRRKLRALQPSFGVGWHACCRVRLCYHPCFESTQHSDCVKRVNI